MLCTYFCCLVKFAGGGGVGGNGCYEPHEAAHDTQLDEQEQVRVPLYPALGHLACLGFRAW